MLTKHFIQQNLYQRMINTMFATLLILAVVYCIILLSLVFSVIERKQNLLAVKDLSSQVSALETRYANEVSNINDTVLAERNFSRIENTTFAVRKDPIASFSILYTH